MQRATRLEQVRHSMLESLGSERQAWQKLERRIVLAADLQSLWYLRSDLMAALASLNGECSAGQTLQRITDLFEGVLPHGMAARPVRRRH